jgi:hypothetical protein
MIDFRFHFSNTDVHFERDKSNSICNTTAKAYARIISVAKVRSGVRIK